MNVLSLFDGMSCGQIALNRIGIKPSKYYAAEVDKYAIKVTQANYPETIQMGDVTKWREWNIDWASIDLLIGGSPCQGFSFAGKQAGTSATLDDEEIIVTTREIYLDARSRGAVFHSQSYLFWEYVLCLDHIKSVNPNVKFLLENVRMKKELLQMISETLNVESIFINSALVSAQNRQRHYWCNWYAEQPEYEGILLADILEVYPTNSTFMTENFKARNAHILRDDLEGKAKSLSAMEYVKNGRQGDYINCTVSMGMGYNRNDGLRNELTKSYPLNATDWRGLNRNQNQTAVVKGKAYRKLTPTECERLQTIPDNYTNHVSNTQRYKMLGNGWTVNVIAHLFNASK